MIVVLFAVYAGVIQPSGAQGPTYGWKQPLPQNNHQWKPTGLKGLQYQQYTNNNNRLPYPTSNSPNMPGLPPLPSHMQPMEIRPTKNYPGQLYPSLPIADNTPVYEPLMTKNNFRYNTGLNPATNGFRG